MTSGKTDAPLERQSRRQLAEAVSRRYRDADGFGRHFAKNKIRHDPFFSDVFQSDWLSSPLQVATDNSVDVLDLGCGQGLLAMALAERGALPGSYHGIEYSAANVARAHSAFATIDPERLRPSCVHGNIVTAPFPSARRVALIDVLHYLQPADQEQVLRRVRAALAGQGKLLLRIGDAGSRQNNRLSQWIDRIVSYGRGVGGQVHCRSLAEWMALLQSLGFAPRVVSRSESAFYENVLIVAELNG